MKIKSDFVTNSSSTSYIVCIPEKFDIDMFISLLSDMDEIDNKELFYNKIKDVVKELKDYGTLDQYENELEFYRLSDLLSELELDVLSYDSPSDCGVIININCQKFRNKSDIIQSGGWGIKHGGWGIK